jgi:hypothetical protein
MIVPTIDCKGYELRAYSRQEFPLHREPYAKDSRKFLSVVRIATVRPSEGNARRYTTLFATANPTTADGAIDLAMQHGKDVIDGKIQADRL